MVEPHDLDEVAACAAGVWPALPRIARTLRQPEKPGKLEAPAGRSRLGYGLNVLWFVLDGLRMGLGCQREQRFCVPGAEAQAAGELVAL